MMSLFKKLSTIAGISSVLPVLFLLLVLTKCNYPHWYFDDIKVEATFSEDGTCLFSIDGEVVTNDEYVQEIELISRDCTGCTAEGLDGYNISCSLRFEKWDHREPALYMSIADRPFVVLEKGVHSLSEEQGRIEVPGTHATIISPPEYKKDGSDNGVRGALLKAVSGQLVINEVRDNASLRKQKRSIVGALSAKAQRRYTGY